MSSLEMRDSTFWILTALASERRHGYSLIQEIKALSHGELVVKVATLYGALDRLEKQGLVAPDGDEVVEGRLRRYFRITDEGSGRLAQELSRLEAKAARARTALRPGLTLFVRSGT